MVFVRFARFLRSRDESMELWPVAGERENTITLVMGSEWVKNLVVLNKW